ncbi:MAG: permease, partial [bacterium]
MAQAFLHAAPTVLVGILVAAILRVLIRQEQTSALFGGRSWRQLPQAWGLGMLLPVCSLGAIPIMSELRRAGIQGGTIMAFGLTAPIFNPVSLLYGLSLSRPLVILSICVCSFVIVTIVGASWDYIFATPPVAQEKNPRFPYGLRRILGVGLTVLRLGWNRDTVW